MNKLQMLAYIQDWKNKKEEEGFIPTVQNLIEDLISDTEETVIVPNGPDDFDVEVVEK